MKGVKSRVGSLRADRAELTRRRIEASARALFARRGYAATTLREIADAAGVAVQSVYAIYGSKAGILRALRESVRDDPEAAAAFARTVDAPDAAAALRAFARSIRLRWERGGDIAAIHAAAAAADPEVRAELEAVLAVRRRGIGGLARAIMELDPPLGDATRIAAIADALTLPEVYAELTSVHGWTPDAYEAWLSIALRREILGLDPASS
jgi:AcrR family transcriptional regulator